MRILFTCRKKNLKIQEEVIYCVKKSDFWEVPIKFWDAPIMMLSAALCVCVCGIKFDMKYSHMSRNKITLGLSYFIPVAIP